MADQAVAIIPARGGSKGVPRKNLAKVGGIPLLTRAISACLAATRISRVLVTSEDPEILAVAEWSGAAPIWRPGELALDESPTLPAIWHAMAEVDRQERVAIVQCTSPFLLACHVDLCCEGLDRSPGAVVAILAAEFHSVFWEGPPVSGGHPRCLSLPDQSLRGRRQDCPGPLLVETGACYVYRWEHFLAHGDRITTAQTVLVPVPFWPYGVQVDSPVDLAAAKCLETAGPLW